MSDGITSVITGLYNIVATKENCSYATYTLLTKLSKNNYQIYNNENINLKIINAQQKSTATLKYNLYYNSNFDINTFISAYNWSDNIKYKSISCYSQILPSEISARLISKYPNGIYSISAVGDKICIPCSLLNVTFSTIFPSVLPQFTKIYYPYISTKSLKIADYGVKFNEDLNFNGFIASTYISSVSNNNATLCGRYNNQSYIIVPTSLTNFILSTKYRFNQFIQDPLSTIYISGYPVYAEIKLDNLCCVTDNNYKTYQNLLTSGNIVSTVNCDLTNLTYNIIYNNMYYYDKKTSTQVPCNETSANLYKIDVEIIGNSSCFSNKEETIINKSTCLSCIRLNSYSYLNSYDFHIPSYPSYNTDMYLNLSSYFIKNIGYNDLFDFNFNTNKDLKFKLSCKSKKVSEIPFIISTQCFNKTLVPVNINLSANISRHVFNTIQNNTNIGSYYNTDNYELSTILSTYITGLTNDTQISLSASFNNNIYANTLSANDSFQNSLSSIEIKYRPIINSCYTLTSQIQLPERTAVIDNYIGKYYNILNNRNYYIYIDSTTYNLSSSMFNKSYIPSTNLSSFDSSIINEKAYIINGLTANIPEEIYEISAQNIIKNSNLSSFMDNNGYLDLYNYAGINTLITNYSVFNLIYYKLADSMYLKLDDLFIGSKNVNYKFESNLSANISTNMIVNQKKLLAFENINNISSTINNFLITDNLTSSNIDFNIISFNKNHYFISQYNAELSSYILKDWTNTINNNYGVSTLSFIYNPNISYLITTTNNIKYGGSIQNGIISTDFYNNFTNFQLLSNIVSAYYVMLPEISSYTYISAGDVTPEDLENNILNNEKTITYYQYPILSTSTYSSILMSKQNSYKEILSSNILSSKLLEFTLYDTVQNLIDNVSTNIISSNYYNIYINNKNLIVHYTYQTTQSISYLPVQVYFKLKDNNKFGILEIFFDKNEKEQ